MALLDIDDIHVFYDNIEALKGISFAVEAKQIVTLVGANGAGDIRLDGESLGEIEAHEITALGLVQVPEGRRIFARLTVEENLAMGAFTRNDRHGIAEDKARMLTLFPRLKERLKQVAG